MIPEVQEFVAGKAAALAHQVARVRKSSIASVRQAARGSAGSVRAFRNPVRIVARSTVKLTNVSQTFSQNLLELQADMLTSAISDVALRLERASRAESLSELVRDQVDLVPATRSRIAEETQRAVSIFRTAGRDVRHVASHALERIKETDGEPVAATARTAKRRTGKATRKVARKTSRVRKAA